MHTELAQNGGDVRLDGGLRDIELIGDLLVEQPLGQHVEHPELLGSQRGDGLGEAGLLLVGIADDIGQLRRQPHLPVENLAYRLGNQLKRGGLGNESRGAVVYGATNHMGLIAARNHRHRDIRGLATQLDKPREAVGPRHMQIEQDQIGIGVAGHHLGRCLHGIGLDDLGLGRQLP